VSLRVLSFRQPWASLVLDGKDVENRSWRTNHRGLLVVHASLGRAATASHRAAHVDLADELRYPRGVLLGVVEVVDCVRTSSSPWAEKGQWHWLLDNPCRLRESIPYRGSLGLQPLSPYFRRRVLALLPRRHPLAR
jgi:hypothetical protein